MTVDTQVDEVVQRLSDEGFEFHRIEEAPWIPQIETRLGLRLPPAYRSLVTRYLFPVIELDSIELFANLGDGSEYDLKNALFRDPFMSPFLAKHGLIHIGHPYIGNYDPICFDFRAGQTDHEPGLVQLNHEDILQDRSTVGVAPFASNFLSIFGTQLR